MFGKLLKYDLSAQLRKLLPLYLLTAAAWAALLIALVTDALKNTPVMIVLEIACIALTVSVAVVTLIRIVERYRNETYGSQAYFNMTLPASENEHLLSGAFTDVITMIISVAACLIPSVLLIGSMASLPVSFADVFASFWGDILLALGISIVVCFKLVFQIYLSISIGSMVPRRHSVISILAFIGIEIAVVMCKKITHIFGIVNVSIFSAKEQSAGAVTGSHLAPGDTAAAYIFYGACAVVFFLITRWLLKKHMNLE